MLRVSFNKNRWRCRDCWWFCCPESRLSNIFWSYWSPWWQTGRIKLHSGRIKYKSGRIKHCSGHLKNKTGRIKSYSRHIKHESGRIKLQSGHHKYYSGIVKLQAGRIYLISESRKILVISRSEYVSKDNLIKETRTKQVCNETQLLRACFCIITELFLTCLLTFFSAFHILIFSVL